MLDAAFLTACLTISRPLVFLFFFSFFFPIHNPLDVF